MFPSLSITGADLDSQLLYLAFLGLLVLVGTVIRLKVPILRKWHIPASLVGGFVGLILGPYILNVIPAEVMANWSNLTGRLIVIVFAPMFMGIKGFFQKGDGKLALGTVCAHHMNGAMQFALPLLLGALLLEPVFGVNPLFGCIVEEGWIGGHGTAGGMGAVFEPLGFMEGQTLATTSATIGLLFGVIGGVVFINIGIRKGYTNYVKTESKLAIDSTPEIYLEEQPVDTHKAVSTDVINSLAFHATIVALAIFLGYFANLLIFQFTGLFLSWFICSAFVGVILNSLINKTKYSAMMDRATFVNIQGIALDFLVCGAVASLNLTVLVDNVVPLAILMVVSAVQMVWYLFYYCRRVLGQDWFEHGIFFYGSGTGVSATGYLLLRIVDPNYQSNTVKRVALAAPFSWFYGGGVLTTMVPVLVAQRGSLVIGLVFLGVSILFMLIPVVFKIWKKMPANPVD